jgi:four helix bundle protein
MEDNLENFGIYKLAMGLWDVFWKEDSELLMKDVRGKEIARQMTRSIYSISANIEEGYGRGFGKEYPQFLRISRGSARESKGGYIRARFLLGEETVAKRTETLNKIIAGLNNTLKTIKEK